MPPSGKESNPKHYRRSKAVTLYNEFPDRSDYNLGPPGWGQVADSPYLGPGDAVAPSAAQPSSRLESQ